MKFNMRALLFLALVAIEYVVAQSLPPCAQTCVAKTKTKCKSTDFICACSDGKYLPKLQKCIEKTCDEGSRSQAHGYLASLCLAVGYPIEDSTAHAGAILELRDLVPAQQANRVVVIRQLETAFPSESGFDTTTQTQTVTGTATGTAPATNSAETTGASTPNNNDNGGGGLSTGAKVGIGVGVPLGVCLIAGLVALGFFLGRRTKKEQTAAAAAPASGMAQHPHMQPYMAGQTGPVELDQSAQFPGHEMPTQGNTAEMPTGSPPPVHPQPAYKWPHQGQQYPPYGQPGQGQYPQQGQQNYPQPGQQWPLQPQHPSELPEVRR